MGTVTILQETTKNPITLMGERAGICWGADISDAEKNYKRGLNCIQSGHGRVEEFVNLEMILDGYSARVIREWYTHIGGAPTRLQASTRYIDYSRKGFGYIIPKSIKEKLRRWKNTRSSWQRPMKRAVTWKIHMAFRKKMSQMHYLSE